MSLVNGGHPFRLSQVDGLDGGRVRQCLRSGEIRRVFYGVGVDGRVPDTRDLRIEALALVVPEGALVADHTAAAVWGVDTRPPGMLRDLRPMLVVPHGKVRPVGSRAIVRQSTVPDPDAVELRGIRVTSPLRTAVDLLRLCWRPHALAAADALVRAGAVDLTTLRESVASLRRFPGTGQAQELAPRVDPGAESHGESWMRCRIMDAGLPAPILNHEVRLDEGVYRLDGVYLEQRVATEYDGREYHTSAASIAYDRERREILARRNAWTFVLATYERIFGEDDSFERELGDMLGMSVLPRRW